MPATQTPSSTTTSPAWQRWLNRPEIGAVAAVLIVAATALIAGGPAPPEAADADHSAGAGDVAAEDEPGMTLTQVVVISVVEGVTEFLPVSSTGHIILLQRAMHIEQGHAADAFAVCIQAGAILAILGLYRQRTEQLTLGLLRRDPAGIRLAVNIVVAFLPFMFAALLFYEPIMSLFGLRPSVVMWFVGGVVILAVAWWLRGRSPHAGLTMDQLTWRAALVIGFVQVTAVVPGTSRALVAILGGLLVGMSLRSAVEFSFLLGVLTLLGAAVYEGWGHGLEIFEVYGLAIPLVGLVVTGLSAAAAVKWMVAYLDRYSMAIFGYYRIALAIGVAILIAAEIIPE